MKAWKKPVVQVITSAEIKKIVVKAACSHNICLGVMR